MHELELYPIVHRCDGLEPGLYRYDRLRASAGTPSVTPPAPGYPRCRWRPSPPSMKQPPQVLLIVAARFQRMQWKYQSMAYNVILKNVGALYQTMYLVATAMGLAPCGWAAATPTCSRRRPGSTTLPRPPWASSSSGAPWLSQCRSDSPTASPVSSSPARAEGALDPRLHARFQLMERDVESSPRLVPHRPRPPGHGGSAPISPRTTCARSGRQVADLCLRQDIRHIVALSFGTLTATQVLHRGAGSFPFGRAGGAHACGWTERPETWGQLWAAPELHRRSGPRPEMTRHLDELHRLEGHRRAARAARAARPSGREHRWTEFQDWRILRLLQPAQREEDLRRSARRC